MRLLKYGTCGEVSLTRDLVDDVPAYAILSHTWGADDEEVTFDDLERRCNRSKVGRKKIRFCGEQARQYGLQYSGWTHAALYSPTTGDNAPRKGRYLPTKTTGVVTQL